jgi:hypothetical protein
MSVGVVVVAVSQPIELEFGVRVTWGDISRPFLVLREIFIFSKDMVRNNKISVLKEFQMSTTGDVVVLELRKLTHICIFGL